MPNEDDAPEGLTGREYVEYMNRRKQQTQENPRNTGSRSQNVKVNGIPANQQARRDLNKKLREEQKPARDKEEYEKKHPVLTKARRVAGKVHSVIQKTTSRYVEGSDIANRRHEAMRSSGRDTVAGTWVTAPIGASKRKTANDNYSTLFRVPSSLPGLSGLMSGGGFGLGSSLPKESTNTRKKKTTKRKKKPVRRRRY